MVTLKPILRCFKVSSELKVNVHKSKVGGIGVNDNQLDRYATILNFSVMNIPLIYLGIRIRGNNRKIRLWDTTLKKK